MSDEHEPRWHGTGYGGGRMVCRCGDDCEDGYNAHVAGPMNERIAEARRGALTEAANAADRTGDPEQGPVYVATDWLRKRALRGDA